MSRGFLNVGTEVKSTVHVFCVYTGSFNGEVLCQDTEPPSHAICPISLLQLELLSGIPRHECLQRHEVRHQGDIPVSDGRRGPLNLEGTSVTMRDVPAYY